GQKWGTSMTNLEQCIHSGTSVTRRSFVSLAIGSVAALSFAGVLQAADKIKVAAVYVAPVEQQWNSRLHKALRAAQERGDIEYVFSESVSMTDQERVIREY